MQLHGGKNEVVDVQPAYDLPDTRHQFSTIADARRPLLHLTSIAKQSITAHNHLISSCSTNSCDCHEGQQSQCLETSRLFETEFCVWHEYIRSELNNRCDAAVLLYASVVLATPIDWLPDDEMTDMTLKSPRDIIVTLDQICIKYNELEHHPENIKNVNREAVLLMWVLDRLAINNTHLDITRARLKVLDCAVHWIWRCKLLLSIPARDVVIESAQSWRHDDDFDGAAVLTKATKIRSSRALSNKLTYCITRMTAPSGISFFVRAGLMSVDQSTVQYIHAAERDLRSIISHFTAQHCIVANSEHSTIRNATNLMTYLLVGDTPPVGAGGDEIAPATALSVLVSFDALVNTDNSKMSWIERFVHFPYNANEVLSLQAGTGLSTRIQNIGYAIQIHSLYAFVNGRMSPRMFWVQPASWLLWTGVEFVKMTDTMECIRLWMSVSDLDQVSQITGLNFREVSKFIQDNTPNVLELL